MRRRRTAAKALSEHSFDLSISDLMASLLLIFILLLTVTLLNLKREYEEKNLIAERYYQLQVALYEDLYNEFKDDLSEWGAEIDKTTLAIRFKEPDVLFEPNKADLRDRFRKILEDFFPRYISILTKAQYKDDIEEIRIEGHTANPGGRYGYMDLMVLSQNRTNSVLIYVIQLPKISEEVNLDEWVKMKITANGFASSRPIYDLAGEPNWALSRRVEFRIRTNAEEKIREMLEIGERFRK